MKRSLLICVLVMAVLAVGALWLVRTRGMDLATFSLRIGEVLQAHQVTVMGSGFEAAEDTPLPLLVKWNPLHWLLSPERTTIGLSTGARGEIYYLKHGAAAMECRVRRTSDTVQYLEIRCLPKDEADANQLRNVLAEALPGLVVGVRGM